VALSKRARLQEAVVCHSINAKSVFNQTSEVELSEVQDRVMNTFRASVEGAFFTS